MDRTTFRSLGAELVVVVLGILIALGIDQALQGRRDRQMELGYLASLRDDFAITIEWLDDFGRELNARKQEKILDLEQLILGGATSVDTVDVAYSLVLLGFHPVFPVPRATFDDLTGTGNLRVLRDPTLRRSLVDFYLWVETFATHERAMVERAGYFKALADGHLGPSLLGAIADLGWRPSPDVWAPIDNATVPDGLRAAAARSPLLSRIRQNQSLVEALSTVMDDLYLQKRQYESLGQRARSVLAAFPEGGT